MAGYIGSKSSVTLVDGYTEAEANAEFVNDPNGAITVDGSNVGIGTSNPTRQLEVSKAGTAYIRAADTTNSVNVDMLSASSGGWIGTQSNHDFMLQTNNQERMRIDSSGRVGIGTSSPSYKLDVASTVQIRAGESLRLQNVAGSSAATVQCAGAGSNSDLGFSTAGSERMRIDSSGNLLVGTTIAGQPNEDAMAFTGNMLRLSHANGNTGNYVYFIYNGLGVGSIANNGGSAVAYNTSSDYRLKTDAQPMTGASARVQALNPVNFEWISDGTRVDGFLAHEAQAVVPEAITGTKDAMKDEEYEVTPAVEATYDEDGNELTAAVEAVMGTRSVPDYQGIDQSKLVPLLTAALQEALTEIASLKTRVEALEA